eukprot:CAMPEP_0198271850 /NCGR_PEP_ID=MMETSP1447-20131203/50740_1 /TAXON_ID=420782 /ORGANISM="Chaetoceros dichaeta, Strain CCMP1751" /LENGTH=1221 /DNA_ID=CAMNT_0043964667 /DNA_START=40 /DNA_END=3702 /DNA_ORIENTATION=-
MISDIVKCYDIIQHQLPNRQTQLRGMVKRFDDAFFSVQESLRQLLLLSKSITSLTNKKEDNQSNIIAILDRNISSLSNVYSHRCVDWLITETRLEEVRLAQTQLGLVEKDIQSFLLQSKEMPCLPLETFDPLLKQLLNVSSYATDCFQLCNTKASDPDGNSYDDSYGQVFSIASSIISASLIAAQSLFKGFKGRDALDHPGLESKDLQESIDSGTLWGNHMSSMHEWDEVNLSKIVQLLIDLTTEVGTLSERSTEPKEFYLVQSICVDVCALVLQVFDQCQSRLRDCLTHYRNTAKLEYVKLRLFRVLIAKGFCADDVGEGGEGDGEGDISDMKFEDDVEGTGMGTGEGKNDVTDQIENEEQLLGLKGDEEKEDKVENQKQLGEDEAETGLEMEADFDGELFDIPPDEKENKDEQKDEDDDEEELDREMGEESDPNEQVVDEKLWDEEDDDENQEGTEKFEKDSKVAGDTVEDELRTKEDDGEAPSGEEGKDDNDENKADPAAEDHEDNTGKNTEEQDENMINDDLEDDYEDQTSGVDVRNEKDEFDEEGKEGDGDMDIDDNIDIDDDEEGENGKTDDGEISEVEEDSDGEDATGGAGVPDEEEGSEEDNEDVNSLQDGLQTGGHEEEQNIDIDDDLEDDGVQDTNLTGKDDKHYDAHGVAAKNGTDAIRNEEEENEMEEDENAHAENEKEDKNGAAGGSNSENIDGGGGKDEKDGELQSGEDGSQSKSTSTMDTPNPFRDPGDAEKFWHRKLNMAEHSGMEDEDKVEDNNVNDTENPDDSNKDGVFEFTSQEQDNTTQVLGATNDEEMPRLDQQEETSHEEEQNSQNDETTKDGETQEKMKRNKGKQDSLNRSKENSKDDEDGFTTNEMECDEDKVEPQDDTEADVEESSNESYDDDDDLPENRVVTDVAQLQIQDNKDGTDNFLQDEMIAVDDRGFITNEELNEARLLWSQLQAETNSLSRRLCEKLRLVMEPLVATKLQGDYRTGKRINMKRVIGYIASGYRKDKIWLRRTKPAKRNYRVLLAVDDSESMKKGGAGLMALTAMATLANGMSQLEIGELGVASFGEEMKILHPFNMPFTSASGVELVSNFTFNDKRTRTALCVESVIAAFESQSDSSSSMQLVFIISDGRIERDSRSQLRKLVREMSEKNMLPVMIIVEGEQKEDSKSKDSIVNMKEVTFENGRPKIKNFIEDYPFPYYMVLKDMNTLPEVLGDALRQW